MIPATYYAFSFLEAFDMLLLSMLGYPRIVRYCFFSSTYSVVEILQRHLELIRPENSFPYTVKVTPLNQNSVDMISTNLDFCLHLDCEQSGKEFGGFVVGRQRSFYFVTCSFRDIKRRKIPELRILGIGSSPWSSIVSYLRSC